MNRKVFILEDQDAKASIIKRFLTISKDTIAVSRAHNYAEAMFVFSPEMNKKYDLAFFDFNLKEEKTGLDVAKLAKGMGVQFDKVIIDSSDEVGSSALLAELQNSERLKTDELVLLPNRIKEGKIKVPDTYPFKEN